MNRFLIIAISFSFLAVGCSSQPKKRPLTKAEIRRIKIKKQRILQAKKKAQMERLRRGEGIQGPWEDIESGNYVPTEAELASNSSDSTSEDRVAKKAVTEQKIEKLARTRIYKSKLARKVTNLENLILSKNALLSDYRDNLYEQRRTILELKENDELHEMIKQKKLKRHWKQRKKYSKMIKLIRQEIDSLEDEKRSAEVELLTM